jgi:hypothetical protein
MRCLQKRNWDTVKVRGKKQTVYRDDESFIFPYTEGRDLGIKDTQFWKNIVKLVAIGFLEVEHQGGWYQKHERKKDYSRYKLSERWRKYGTSEFIKVEKHKVLPKHFHIQENIERKKLEVTSRKRSGLLHESEDDRRKSINNRLHESEGDKSAMENRQSLAVTA